MAIPPVSLQRFEDHKDNPMVQALLQFISFNLEQPLEQVASWGIEVSDKPVRTFYLRFTDGTKVSGLMAEIWQVQVLDWKEEVHTNATANQTLVFGK